ncbi:hypothetical protein L313_1050 [Acinetobacter haemolyticus CIP 64.3 = MTCC 9819]|nr:hypothetical protein L313_1050 [Acinetobacter haemolyticus CIP 64.3 = MTCC 9819]
MVNFPPIPKDASKPVVVGDLNQANARECDRNVHNIDTTVALLLTLGYF